MAKTSQKISDQYAHIDWTELASLDPDEVVTHSFVRDIRLSSGRILALITLDNGRDHTRPNTLGPATLLELNGVLDALTARAAAGEIHGVAITGKPYIIHWAKLIFSCEATIAFGGLPTIVPIPPILAL